MNEYQEGCREGVVLAAEDVTDLFEADQINEDLISRVQARLQAGIGDRADDSEFHRGMHASYENIRGRILPVLSEKLEPEELLKRISAILSDGAEIGDGEEANG